MAIKMSQASNRNLQDATELTNDLLVMAEPSVAYKKQCPCLPKKMLGSWMENDAESAKVQLVCYAQTISEMPRVGDKLFGPRAHRKA